MAENYIRAGQRQPGYVGRGQRQSGYVGAGQRQEGYNDGRNDPPGYRRASGIINARQTPRTTKGFGGLNSFYALQNRDVPAFPRPGFKGQSAGEIGEYMTKSNVALNRDGSVSPRNQIMGRDRSAMDRRSGQPPTVRAPMAVAPTGGDGGGPMGAIARTAGSVMNAAAKVAQSSTGGGDMSPRREFGGRQQDRMPSPTANPRGPLPTAADTAARAQEMRDERSMQQDLRSGTSRTMGSSLFAPNAQSLGSNMGSVSSISSKYGTGSVEWLSPQQQAARPGGTAKDDLGRVQPIRREIARMTENQATKGIGPGGEQAPPSDKKDPMGQKEPMAAQKDGADKPGEKGAKPGGNIQAAEGPNAEDLYEAAAPLIEGAGKKKGAKKT